jgi:hypothetical protein
MDEMYDPIVGRGQLLIHLAEAIDVTSSAKAKAHLLEYADKVQRSVKVPEQQEEDKDNLVSFPGGKH